MVDSSVVRIAVACEDQAQRAVVTTLAGRVVLEEARNRLADWVESHLDQQMRFCGLDCNDATPEHLRYYPIHRIASDFEKLSIRGRPIRALHGLGGGPGIQRWRRLFILFGTKQPSPDALFVVLDTDGDLSRPADLHAARGQSPRPSFPVLIATPHQEVEAWLLAGFEPGSREEIQRLKALKKDKAKKLSFSPIEEPHRLTAHPNDAATDAKRVLRFLVLGEYVSRPPTLQELPDLCDRTLQDLRRLERHGGDCLLNR